MRPISSRAAAAALAMALVGLPGQSAIAACKKMGFLVNDYGKEGPTQDAKELLDKHIANWAKEKGITKYTVGKKDVSCELFLNLIVVDEHTCTASATVCWDDKPAQPGATPAKAETSATGTTNADNKETKPAKPAPAAATTAPPPATDAAKSAPADAPQPASTIETGTLPLTNAPAPAEASTATPAAADAEATPAEGSSTERDSAAAAAAAAERAAAAAERAAAAAERAAKAAAESVGETGAAVPPAKTPMVPPLMPKP